MFGFKFPGEHKDELDGRAYIPEGDINAIGRVGFGELRRLIRNGRPHNLAGHADEPYVRRQPNIPVAQCLFLFGRIYSGGIDLTLCMINETQQRYEQGQYSSGPR